MSGINHVSYDKDFYAWAMENAELLREKRFNELDIENLAEEIESMGKSDRRSVFSHLRVLLAHLLKWQYQAEHRSNSWKSSIRNARFHIQKLIEDSPSLKTQIPEKFEAIYKDAAIIASDETGIIENYFPKKCPFTLEQCLNDEFLPE